MYAAMCDGQGERDFEKKQATLADGPGTWVPTSSREKEPLSFLLARSSQIFSWNPRHLCPPVTTRRRGLRNSSIVGSTSHLSPIFRWKKSQSGGEATEVDLKSRLCVAVRFPKCKKCTRQTVIPPIPPNASSRLNVDPPNYPVDSRNATFSAANGKVRSLSSPRNLKSTVRYGS